MVQPNHVGCKWTQQNKHFRSSVWNWEGELVSASFPKFVNWGENPENFPVPTSLKHCSITTKLDGSTLIVSKYKGTLIVRTRGTLDATLLDNGHEIEQFKGIFATLQELYPEDTWGQSFLFEWLSPLNRIVIHYVEAELRLIGAVDHSDYSLWLQSNLDELAKLIGVERPNYSQFISAEHLTCSVDKWIGVEGVCVYSKNGQEIHKVKALDYLVRHRLKDEFRSLERVVDFFISSDCPPYKTFYHLVASVVDYETAESCRGDISKCIDAWKEVKEILSGMGVFVDKIRSYPTRKEQALDITKSYGNTNRAGFVFAMLDGKPLIADNYKKLMWQVLKK